MSSFFRRLWNLIDRRRFRTELDEEMAFHREQAERDGPGKRDAQCQQCGGDGFANEERGDVHVQPAGAGSGTGPVPGCAECSLAGALRKRPASRSKNR